MAALKTTPDVAPAGTKVTISGTGLPAGKAVSLVWMTANVRFVLDPRPDSLDYIGRKVDKIGVALANATTDASGAFKVTFVAPKDYGGLHDIFAVINGKQVAKGGYLLERTVKISPAKGPVGTPITVTVNGMGSPTYESVASILYDNKYAGAVSANTTRGWTTFKIRASGKPGTHYISYEGSSHTVPYLNMEQSPVPVDRCPQAEVHGDEGRRCAQAHPRVADGGAADDERADDRSLHQRHRLGDGQARFDLGPDPHQGERDGCRADPERAGSAAVDERRRQPGQLHGAVLELRQRAARIGHGRRRRDAEDGDQGPGRPRRLARRPGRPERPDQGAGPVLRQAELRHIPKTVKAGEPFIVEIKGVGWTQIDNTVAVTYDNSYIGYACGFNSNGYVRIQLMATGEPGTHLIDLYPLLYTQQPAYAYSQLGMVPLLGFANDAPGLAAGYDLPAYRLAITVVE